MHSHEDIHRQHMQRLSVLWSRYQSNVMGFIMSVVPNYHDAQDVLQNTAEGVAASFHTYDQAKAFVPWAIGIASHKVADYKRTQAKNDKLFDPTTIEAIVHAHERVETEVSPLQEALAHCLKRLNERGRQLVELRYLRELPATRVAEIMGIKANTVYVMLQRVRNMLGKCIEQRMEAEES